MKAYVFPGQGAQFEGMGKDMYESSDVARALMDEANEALGFPITGIMFEGHADDLKQTRVTQPAIFIHSIARAKMAGPDFAPALVAGHSLGEFSALVAVGALSFGEGLQLVYQRALAMQKACEAEKSTMAAILGLEDEVVERVCSEVGELVVPANYNSPGQLVISGTLAGVEKAVEKLQEAGARRAVILQVGGAFHSPLMQPAQDELRLAIEKARFSRPSCPVYQNVDARPYTDPEKIKENLIAQLTAPVLWTQTMKNMIGDGASEFVEVGGAGTTLQGLVKKIDRKFPSRAL